MVGVDIYPLLPQHSLNSFSVSTMAKSSSLVMVYLDCMPESFRLKNAFILLSDYCS